MRTAQARARGATAKPQKKRGKASPEGARRRIPQQDRSRARVEAILRTTLRLIGEGGDASMREIAAAAEIPIASIYQYFPDKTAVLHAIHVEFYARMRIRIERALTSVERVQDIPTFAAAMIDALVLELGSAESRLNVWTASQSLEAIRKLDTKEALELAQLVCARVVSVGKGVDAEAVRDLCVFAVVMAGPVVRQSFIMPKAEGQRLIRELKALIRLRIATIELPASSLR
ncbi:MAG TPA: TetR family transcriptional regulator [Polyangiaceae bacterium]|nr:TetR family transcriptional regulator [Polyangiaceae bacterium]